MHTARLLTVSHSVKFGGGSAQPPGCRSPRMQILKGCRPPGCRPLCEQTDVKMQYGKSSTKNCVSVERTENAHYTTTKTQTETRREDTLPYV